MTGHSSEARRVRRELNAELASTAAASGQALEWSAAERQILALTASAIDRKCDLATDYAAATDAKGRVKLATELRLVEAHIERLLRRIKTDIPQPESTTTQKARMAANTRWNREKGVG